MTPPHEAKAAETVPAWKLALMAHENDCAVRAKADTLTVKVAELSTTIKVWGAAVSAVVIIVTTLGVLAVKGIVSDMRGHADSSVLMGTAHAAPATGAAPTK